MIKGQQLQLPARLIKQPLNGAMNNSISPRAQQFNHVVAVGALAVHTVDDQQLEGLI